VCLLQDGGWVYNFYYYYDGIGIMDTVWKMMDYDDVLIR
jgi:hypothetical protein